MPNKNDTKVAETPEKKNTYITLHKNFVRENIEYVVMVFMSVLLNLLVVSCFVEFG